VTGFIIGKTVTVNKILYWGRKMKMKKNKLFITLLVSLLVGLFMLTAVGAESKPVTITMGYLGAIGSVEDIAVKEIAKVAEKKSNGKLKIQLYPAGQLGSFDSELSNIALGTQDSGWGELSFLGNIVKDYQIMSMPYAFRDQNHLNKFLDSSIGKQMKQKLLQKGLFLLTMHGNQLPRTLVSKKPVKTPDDLKGIKMRVPSWPISLKAWEALGTKPTMVNWGEVYLALSQNVVSAMECGFEWIYPCKFYEVAKYITLTNHVRGVRGLIINPAKYNSLSGNLKRVLYKAAIAGENLYNKEVALAQDEHTKLMLKEGAVIQKVDERLFQKRVLPIVAECEKEGMWSKGLFDRAQKVK
jgi:tripartite ATP-independent transporter DctP family solute receptor